MVQRCSRKTGNYFSVEREDNIKEQCSHCSVKTV